MTESSVALDNASTSTHLVTYSIATKIYVFWFDDELIGQQNRGSITQMV